MFRKGRQAIESIACRFWGVASNQSGLRLMEMTVVAAILATLAALTAVAVTGGG